MSAVPAPPAPPATEWRLHPRWERAAVALFLTALAAPGLATLAGVDAGTTRSENRQLAPPPELAPTWRALAAFPDAFTSYFQDRFAFRATLVRWQAALRLRVLRVSPSPTVIRGKDGWLFYADDGALDDYLSAVPLSAADLEVWTTTLQHTQDWLAARGIAYLFVVAPDKHAIYPEFMPDTIRRTGHTSRTDQLVAHLQARSTVQVLDLGPAMLAAKREARVYHRTDSHWNDVGAFAATQAILARLRAVAGGAVPGLAPDDVRTFERRDAPAPGKDLARMLGLEDWLTEDDLRMRPRQPAARVVEPASPDPGFDDGRLATEVGGTDLPRAVVYRDSFGSALVPFLSEHFGRALFLWEYDVDPRLVEQERPQVVIHEWAGRRFSTRLPYDAFAAAAAPTPPISNSGGARR